MVDAFAARGYTPKVIEPDSPNGTLDDMLKHLSDFLKDNHFCDCPTDELVLLISAHGYGGKYNPTGKVAMRFQPDGPGPDQPAVTWITHEDLAAKLKGLGLKPEKLRLIFYSCRSGDAYRKGRYGKQLPGVFIITSTPTNKRLGASKFFPGCLVKCVKDGANKSWADLAKCLKDCVKKHFDDPANENYKKWLNPPWIGHPPNW